MFGQPSGQPWYFESTAHAEALNRLVYVAEQGEGFVLLMADHGAGKTTVLNQVHTECRRFGHSAVFINVAALDETSFLWHVCGALSISPHSDQTRSELMAAIRDELAGRAVCNHRTVIILDDLHSAGADLSLMVQFLVAMNQQTSGAVSVIVAAEQTLSGDFQNLSVLKVRLPLLNDIESRKFIRGKLQSVDVSPDILSEECLERLVCIGGGSPAQLSRLCEVVSVAESTHGHITLTPDDLTVLTAEILGI